VGDEDGVVVIPLRDAQTVLARLAAVRTAEKSAEAAVKAGATSMPSWHDIMRNAKIVQS